ncbi:MAG: ribonuclease Y [Verrucomicrobia bacterium]|nr:ribonuclease Y [Verrucomicrobiota bacterium]
MIPVYQGLLYFAAGTVFAVALGWVYLRKLQSYQDAKQKQQLEILQRETELAGKEYRSKLELEWEKKRLSLEQEIHSQRTELQAKEDEVISALLNAEKELDVLNRRKTTMDERLAAVDRREEELRTLSVELRRNLQSIAKFSEEEARDLLQAEVRRECEDELRELRQDLLGKGEQEIRGEARKTLIAAMQRLCSQPQHDVNATIVRLPTDDMKGRIIGREGRNIKTFESATGTTLLIDETPDSVLVSSFDPVRREVARMALEALIKDGRIHPTSIEEAVHKADQEVRQSFTVFGEEVILRLRMSRVSPEVLNLLGRLRYHLSNNQNTLDHCMETANLCALMAAEVGLNPDIAKRCGLFHDIGKALSEEFPGSHAIAGANFLKRHGNEDPIVINAVAAHHEEVPPESAYVPLLMMADSLSAMRPGARAESMDAYIQRVRNLESIAKSYQGVAEAYAIQAGREIRVVVLPEMVSDEDSRLLARSMRRRIEDELQYPGTIRVTVIREQRISEIAR